MIDALGPAVDAMEATGSETEALAALALKPPRRGATRRSSMWHARAAPPTWVNVRRGTWIRVRPRQRTWWRRPHGRWPRLAKRTLASAVR